MRVNINAVDTTQGMSEFKVGFLTLQPGERAIVRFLLDSENDFDVVTLHSTETAEGKPIRVDCIRDAHDPVDMCPLCASGAKIEQRVFLRLLQYVDAGDGVTFIPKAKIWDRSVRSDLITTLKTYLMDYGPLSQIVCSITRNGSGLDTTYTVSPNLPGGERYILDASAFEDFDVVGTIVRSWDAEQMIEFLSTGVIPAKKEDGNVAPVNAYAGAVPAGQAFTAQTPVTPQPTPAPAYAPQPAPVPQSTAEMSNRPRRVYN